VQRVARRRQHHFYEYRRGVRVSAAAKVRSRQQGEHHAPLAWVLVRQLGDGPPLDVESTLVLACAVCRRFDHARLAGLELRDGDASDAVGAKHAGDGHRQCQLGLHVRQ
jgi:hypothetical protein